MRDEHLTTTAWLGLAVFVVRRSSGMRDRMNELSLYEDSDFSFRFADDQLIPRLHIEGVPAGQQICVFKIDPTTRNKLELLTTATVGDDGWVNLLEPLRVKAGETLMAVPETGHLKYSPSKMLGTALVVAGLLALVGYLGGLLQGGGNQHLLALCCGALGAVVVLLGYGPIAFLIGALGAVAARFRRITGGTTRR